MQRDLPIAQFCAIFAISRSGSRRRTKKLQQVEAAERLISEIDPQKTYTYEYVCFRITGYRPDVVCPDADHGRRPAARPAAVRRGSLGRGRA